MTGTKTAAVVLAVVILAGAAFTLGRFTAPGGDASADSTATTTPVLDEGTPQIKTGTSNGDGPIDRNVVVINVDDLPSSLVDYLPRTRRLLAPSSLEFTNHIVSTPTCCPSRASLFSGLEPHNHGVITDVASASRFDHERSVAVSLHEAGYTTAHYGTYLTGFRAVQPLVPPGWDDFHALVPDNGDARGYFDYTMLENGESVSYGSDPAEYSTRLLGERTVGFIEANAGTSPFFVYYAPFAGRAPSTAEDAHDGSLDDVEFVPGANVNEADVADKPRWVRDSEPLDDEQLAAIDQRQRDMAESLATVDEMVADIVTALEQGGVLDKTLIVFSSDNGLLLGAHRQEGAECPYEECIRTPLIVFNPDATVVGTSPALVSPTDYAPTILDWLDVQPGWHMDGYSILGAFTDSDWDAREAKLIQVLGRPFNQNRNFIGLRTSTHTYVEYRNGERELYDLSTDPDQLTNIVDDPTQAEVVDDLAVTLDGRRQETDLSLSFDVDEPDVAQGAEIELTFTVTNTGRRMANQVYVTYDTPDSFRTVGCGGSDEARCYSFGNRQEVRFMTVDAGADVTGTVRLAVRDAAFAEAVPFSARVEPFNTVDFNPDNDVSGFEIIIR